MWLVRLISTTCRLHAAQRGSSPVRITVGMSVTVRARIRVTVEVRVS